MGFFRSQGRKKGGVGNGSVNSPNSFETNSNDDKVTVRVGEGRAKAQLFSFRKSRSGWSNNSSNSKKVFYGSTPETTSYTPSVSSSGVTHSTNETTKGALSPELMLLSRRDSYTQQAGADTSSTSLSSMLETLKILAVSDGKFVSPKAVSLYQDVEVMTPESRELLSQQREVIRKILFDNSNEAYSHDVEVDHVMTETEDNKGDTSTDDDDDDDDDDSRALSPPPPPPPPYNPEQENVGASMISQEVSLSGLIRYATDQYNNEDDDIYNICNSQSSPSNGIHDKYKALPPPIEEEYDHELHNLKVFSSTGRSVPISCDLTFTNSELASIPGGSSHSTTEVLSVRTGPSSFQHVKVTVASPGQTPDRSTIIERPTIDSPMDELSPRIAAPVASKMACQALSPPTILYRQTSDSKGQPEDESHYYEMLTARVESPIPDDERLEYDKDEMLEIMRTNSSGGALNVVDVRDRPLSGGKNQVTRSSGSVASSIEPPGITSVELSSGVDPALFHPTAVRGTISDVDKIINPNQNITDRETEGATSEQGIKNASNIAVENPTRTGDGINATTHSYLCNVADPNSVTQNLMQALNCVGGYDNAVGKVNEAEQARKMGVLQEKVKSRWNVSSKMSMSYGADANSVVVKKAPSFVYSRDDESTDRFLRRVTSYGFVLLFLKAPGSLGNPTEDWNGRTVTMTIEKGVISSLPPKTPFSTSSGYSSVTWSARSGSINSVSSIKTMPPPIVKHPRLQWMSVAGGLTTGVSTTSVDLLNIQAVAAFGGDTERDATISPGPSNANEIEPCFFTVTTGEGVVHMFEAATNEERNRIVKGLKCAIARLSFLLVSGKHTSISEFYSNAVVPYDSGSPKNPMNVGSYDRHPISSKPVISDISRLTEEVPSDDLVTPIGQSQPPSPNHTMDRVAHMFLDI